MSSSLRDKVNAIYIPEDWTNDPKELADFSFTNDLISFKFPSDKGIPILALHNDGRFLFEDGHCFYV